MDGILASFFFPLLLLAFLSVLMYHPVVMSGTDAVVADAVRDPWETTDKQKTIQSRRLWLDRRRTPRWSASPRWWVAVVVVVKEELVDVVREKEISKDSSC